MQQKSPVVSGTLAIYH